jgi:hypothetical protein
MLWNGSWNKTPDWEHCGKAVNIGLCCVLIFSGQVNGKLMDEIGKVFADLSSSPNSASLFKVFFHSLSSSRRLINPYILASYNCIHILRSATTTSTLKQKTFLFLLVLSQRYGRVLYAD